MNRNRKRKKLSRWRLTLAFTLIIFIVFLLTSVIVAAILFVGNYFGILSISELSNSLLSLIYLALFSILIGTLLTAILSRIPLKPFNAIITATDTLASGDFSVRLNLKGTPEIQRFTTSFNHMAEELGSSEMLRTDFVNNFSHEFKSPIVSIRGFAKMLKYNDLSKEEYNEYLDIIISESERLSQLATNVLNLSKVENQTFLSSPKEYNLTEQIRLAVAMMAQKWSSKKVSFDFDCDEIFFYGNEELMNQVWINLIDNAIKFSPANDNINMSLKCQSNTILFTIHDNGPGMGEEVQKHIFDKFYQGNSSHTSQGNGLGLTIAYKIVKLHSGSIQVSSSQTSGTTFEIELPNKDRISCK